MPDIAMKMILANGKTVKVSLGEMREFITELSAPLANAYWRHSELLSEEEVMKFLKRESSEDEVRKIARYLLIYTENLAFTAYLFDKAEGKPDRTKEFNIPAVKKLRGLYQALSGDLPVLLEDGALIEHRQGKDGIAGMVNEMESLCLEIGADPL